MTKINSLFYFFHRLTLLIVKTKACYYSKLIKCCGKGLKVWGDFHIKNPQNIIFGDNVSLNDGVYLNGKGTIIIGDNVSISAGAKIISTMLCPEEFIKTKVHLDKEVIVGNNVQIGAGAIILPGVRIGDNVIIGAGSVVTKDIRDNVIVVGNPANVLRELI